MKFKYLFISLWAFFAITAAQITDELNIPVENDNQFPSDNVLDTDGTVIDDSDVGTGTNDSVAESIVPEVWDEPLEISKDQDDLEKLTDTVDSEGTEYPFEEPSEVTEDPVETTEVQEEPTEEVELEEDTFGTNKVIENSLTDEQPLEETTQIPEVDNTEEFGSNEYTEGAPETNGDINEPLNQEEPVGTSEVYQEQLGSIDQTREPFTIGNELLDDVAAVAPETTELPQPIRTSDVEGDINVKEITNAVEIKSEVFDTIELKEEPTTESVDLLATDHTEDLASTAFSEETLKTIENINELSSKEVPVGISGLYESQLGTTDQVDGTEEQTSTENILLDENNLAALASEITKVEGPIPISNAQEDILSGDINEISESTDDNNKIAEQEINVMGKVQDTADAVEVKSGFLDTKEVGEEPIPVTESEGLFDTATETSDDLNVFGVADNELLLPNQEETSPPEANDFQEEVSATTELTEDVLETEGFADVESTRIANEGTTNETTEVQEDSGFGDETEEATTESSESLLGNVKLHSLPGIIPALSTTEETTCPESCICVTEGDSDEYKVDCSGRQLTELPKPLNPKTTELNLENNKLTAISNEISALKNLKVLNANNNDIMDIVSGSLSELPELTSLKLGNNSLISYPEELMKFGLSKLQELDLGGNEMDITSENFTNFTSLRKLILPTSNTNLAQGVCANLKDSLQTVCSGSCDVQSIDCSDSSKDLQNALDFTLPGLIALSNQPETNLVQSGDAKTLMNTAKEIIDETVISSPTDTKSESIDNAVQSGKVAIQSTLVKAQETVSSGNGNIESSLGDTLLDFAIPGLIALSNGPEESATGNQKAMPLVPAETPTLSETSTTSNEFSLRSAINKSPGEESTEAAKSESSKTEADVTVGAATEATKGGVDKSVIGIIVAGMVIVVAGITIKKNWGSIRKKFNSSPRTANERVNGNGTTPEEVPLQQKLPV